jgi:hypothetical protein
MAMVVEVVVLWGQDSARRKPNQLLSAVEHLLSVLLRHLVALVRWYAGIRYGGCCQQHRTVLQPATWVTVSQRR